ncbi:hypothetical protein RQM47_13585 [Rubrivirga sp. S365]|uniref:Uncharacterized protein n=1 Tax=Rubrivirga litoralis TaxID=3075598 RepID=A0ABU3BMV5_9BACT|nr:MULTISPECIES: hypothetical protein [unclassified Rubrivirga]MDT0630608.1 hypothetical protein [Rubrivirga sp. F394]MDT7857679.1 hypothetical protein [Rubrivirga sp. S365]
MRAAPFALLLFTGCATPEAARTVVGNAAPLSDTAYPALAADAPVTVTTGDAPGPYEELAVLVVGPGRSLSDAEEMAVMHARLRREARRLGAQAVVRVAYHNLGENGTKATGTAVRLLDR